MVGLSK